MFKYRNDNKFTMFVENIQGASVKLKPGEEWLTTAAVTASSGLTHVVPAKTTPPKTPKKTKKVIEPVKS
tara:strand:+ start:60 stop:266 length:207 start_codon:yes stop_codon:yes gene_type:complete